MVIDKFFHMMNRKIISFAILLNVVFCLNAQENDFSKWNIKVGYSRINNHCFQYGGNIGELTLEGNHRINRLLELGLYTGFSTSMSKFEFPDGGGFQLSYNIPVLLYGINSNIHLSSLFFEDNFRLGLRIILRPGGFFMFTRDEGFEPARGHYLSLRTGVGVDFRLFRKTGIFAEYSYGFGDGKYRAVKSYKVPGARRQFFIRDVAYKNHIGSFRFGIKIHF